MSTAPDATLNRPHVVYRCYTLAGELLYVGVAQDVEVRMFHHLHHCNRAKQPNGTLQRYMARYTVEVHPTKLAAREAERRAISTEAPLVNRQHNPKRFRKVNKATYGLVSPVHPITAEAFGLLPVLAETAGAA